MSLHPEPGTTPVHMRLGSTTDRPTPTTTPLGQRTLDHLNELVPLLMVGMHGWTEEQRINAARAAWQPVIDCADVQVPGRGQRTRTTQLSGGAILMYDGGPTYPIELRALATAIAAGAYAVGGITIFGLHWCMYHGECERVRSEILAEEALGPIHGPERPPARPVDTVRLAGVS